MVRPKGDSIDRIVLFLCIIVIFTFAAGSCSPVSAGSTAAPVITNISPLSGPVTGGTSVIITGTGFTGTPVVYFGSARASSTVKNVTTIAATAPPASAAGVVDITVNVSGISSVVSPADRYTYATSSPPQIPTPKALPNGDVPTSPDYTGLYSDLNGNGRNDFNDVVLFFRNMNWIKNNEPLQCFDFNGNGRIDFNDVVTLFKKIG